MWRTRDRIYLFGAKYDPQKKEEEKEMRNYGKSYRQRAEVLIRLGLQPADNGLFERLLNASEEEFKRWVEEHGGKVVSHTDIASSPRGACAVIMEYDKVDVLTKDGVVVKLMPKDNCKIVQGEKRQDI